MKVETRTFTNRTNLVLIPQDDFECQLLDELSGNSSPKVGEDGIVYVGEYRTKLADGYGEYYLLIEGAIKK